ncbi:cytochrome b561 and DOMON domain-containing protein At3g61750-like [Zingiber officinale]|uniref:cytochrome b561 and DOMON domain-containing protein At3g61750-like n=1 Tax=Zingiber officinale TaxID=94328 RepID=UPI001C4CF5D7|nr:cytochrome b561 and DOMON domain-containing protein At3g61750-like [Zingiber officinale]
MGRNVVALIVALGFAIVAVGAQQDGCSSELPASLSGNYSSLACKTVWNNFVLRYYQDQDNVLSIVLSTMYSSGWVGMGFSKDGMMVGSSAVVGWVGTTGLPHIQRYYLGGQTSQQVQVDQGNLLFAAATPSVVVDQAKIYLAFQLKFSARLSQQQLLFAIGSATPVNNVLQEHDDKTSVSFDFSTGTSSSSSYPSKLKRTHGALAIFGWGVLLPIGAIVARYCRQWDPLWYYLHTVIQFMGFLFGLAAVIAGRVLYDKLHATVYTHRGIGIFVLVLGILQILAFFLRPNKDSKYRRYWNWYHHWFGRLALFFAAVNIVIGIRIGDAGNSWKIGYGFNLAILLTASIILEVLLWTRWSNKNAPAF